MVNKFKKRTSEKSVNTRDSFPLVGDYFPEISVQTTQGRIFLPSDFSGWWFVLFSHPGDFTPVCTTEFVSFAKNYERFKDLNCELIGLSVDQVFSHMKWVEWIEDELDVEIPFPIIADDSLHVSKALGMIHPQKGSNTVRAVFVVDDNGYIRTILYYPQEIGRNIKEILRTVKGLKTADEKKAALPANWPENELIGDRLIIPPAEDVDQAQKNEDKYECYDWWFCHKDKGD